MNVDDVVVVGVGGLVALEVTGGLLVPHEHIFGHVMTRRSAVISLKQKSSVRVVPQRESVSRGQLVAVVVEVSVVVLVLDVDVEYRYDTNSNGQMLHLMGHLDLKVLPTIPVAKQ